MDLYNVMEGADEAANYSSGYMDGWRDAMKHIQRRIEEEMVCCDIYERLSGEADRGSKQAPDFHDLCYWGGACMALAQSEEECPSGECSRPSAQHG